MSNPMSTFTTTNAPTRFALFLAAVMLIAATHSARAQETSLGEKIPLSVPGQKWQYGKDRYFTPFLSFGRISAAQESFSFSGNYLDDSPIPEIYSFSYLFPEQSGIGMTQLGAEFGDFHGYHGEISYSWERGAIRNKGFGLGIGYNFFYFLQGRVIGRAAVQAFFGNSSTTIDTVNINSLNMTVNNVAIFEQASVAMESRTAQIRPRVEMIVRFPGTSFQLHGSVGYTMPIRTRHELAFSGQGTLGQVTGREAIPSDGLNLLVDDQPWVTKHLMDPRGLYFQIGLGMNLL